MVLNQVCSTGKSTLSITNPRGLLSTGVSAHEGAGVILASSLSLPPLSSLLPLREPERLQTAPDQHLLPSLGAGYFQR